MYFQGRFLRSGVMAFGGLVLGGCGSQYTVTHLPNFPEDAVPKHMPEPGIYYSLPKTEVVIRIPVKRTVTHHSRLSYKFDENVERCSKGEKLLLAARDVLTDHERGRIEVFTRAVPDPAHRYRLDITAEAFSSFTHTIQVTEAGILTNADTTVKDAKTAFALSTAKSLVSLAKVVSGLPVGAAAKAPPTCDDILFAKVMADAIDQETTDKIAGLADQRESLLLEKGLASEPDTLAKALSHLDGKIAEAKGEAVQCKTKLGILPKKIEVTELALFGRFTPKEFAKLEWRPEWKSEGKTEDVWFEPWQLLATTPKPKDEDKQTSILPPVDDGTAQEAVEVWAARDLKALLEDWKLAVQIESPKYQDCVDDCQTPMGDGYRYRLPANGTVTINLTQKRKDDSTVEVVVKADIPVAQYGPIARLPSEFDGLGGNIKLGLYSDFGTLKEVTVGATPQSADTASSVTQLVTDTIEARRAARDAEEAEAAGEEKAELTARKDLLQLQVDILTLEQQLKALEATVDD